MAFTISSKYFYGNEVSEYGQEHHRVDYRTLAKAFNAVMNNSIIGELSSAGFYFESNNDYHYEDYEGNYYTYDEAEEKKDELRAHLEEVEDQLDELEDTEGADEALIDDLKAEMADIEQDLECLEEEKYSDIFQYFIVDDSGAEILKRADEIVFYCEKLDMYVWGVTHWGTSWDYVLTSIEIKEN